MSELKRVKQKERENIVTKLRENKKKYPRYYWQLLKGVENEKNSNTGSRFL